MSKKFLTIFIVLLTVLLWTVSCAVADQVIVIGQNGVYDLAGAMGAIRENAGNAVIYLTGNVNITQQAELPTGIKGLTSVTLASYTGAPVNVSMNGSVICANGVPFTLESGVTLSNGFLVGGKCVAQFGQKETVTESVLVVNGSADYVIGGGLAMGMGTVSTVKITNIILNGSANIVHGGGYAYNGGTADVSSRSSVILTHGSNVSSAVYGGGYASGFSSFAPVRGVHMVAIGTAGSVNKNAGLAENGGNANIGAYTLDPIPTATPTPGIVIEWGGNNNIPEMPNLAVQTTVINIGPNQQARNFTDAVSLIPNNAGNVVFQLTGSIQQSVDVEIPANRGILSVLVMTTSGKATVSWPEDVGFFANGIPTTIASGVVFNNGTIYGGANVGTGNQSNLVSTYLDIAGTVNTVVAGSKAKGSAASAHVGASALVFSGHATGWLYTGGSALYGGYSAVDGAAALTVMQGATIDQSISGGGYAFGSGAQSVVRDAYLDVSGSVVYAVYMGGYADQAGSSSTTGRVTLNLQPAGNVGQSVWYGGRAYKNANVYVDTAMAQISGRVGASVHREGRASDGGKVSIRVIQ